MKHTEGPWRVSGCRASHNGVDYPLVETAYEDHAPILAELCGKDRSWEERVATAMLMAAAPALLKALQNIAAQSVGDDWTAEQAMTYVKQCAREAIAKAAQRLDQQIEKANTYLLKAGKTTPMTYLEGQYACKFCGSADVVYQQFVNDASCQDCGKWQNGE